jgi:hypothetical protein
MINQLVRRASKIFKKTVSATNVRNDFYYNRIYFKRILLFFKSINDCGKYEYAKLTDTDISPLGLKFGCSVNQVTKEMGKAKYSYDNENDVNNHRVLFYRQSFTDTSLLVQLQFYNNQLFFIGLDVLRRLIDENEKIEIINTVIQKYLNQPFKKGEVYPLIQDRNKNSIVINDDMNFSICYVGGDVTIEKQKNIIRAMENVLTEKPEKGSMFYAF